MTNSSTNPFPPSSTAHPIPTTTALTSSEHSWLAGGEEAKTKAVEGAGKDFYLRCMDELSRNPLDFLNGPAGETTNATCRQLTVFVEDTKVYMDEPTQRLIEATYW